MAAPNSVPRENIRGVYNMLGQRVSRALQTEIGDAARLHAHREDCLRLLENVQQVRSSIGDSTCSGSAPACKCPVC